MNDAPHSLDYMFNTFGDWSTGFGQLRVYFNNETRPSLTVPLNLDQTINTDNGCVFGFVRFATALNAMYSSLYATDRFVACLYDF